MAHLSLKGCNNYICFRLMLEIFSYIELNQILCTVLCFNPGMFEELLVFLNLWMLVEKVEFKSGLVFLYLKKKKKHCTYILGYFFYPSAPIKKVSAKQTKVKRIDLKALDSTESLQ